MTWREEIAGIVEAESGDMHDYVRRHLARAGQPSVSLGPTRRGGGASRGDPARHDAQQIAMRAGGLSGKRGVYEHRKRGAMLHYRLASMSRELAAGGVMASAGTYAPRAASPRSGGCRARRRGDRGGAAAGVVAGAGLVPQPPAQLPASLTPRALALARTLDGLGGIYDPELYTRPEQ